MICQDILQRIRNLHVWIYYRLKAIPSALKHSERSTRRPPASMFLGWMEVEVVVEVVV